MKLELGFLCLRRDGLSPSGLNRRENKNSIFIRERGRRWAAITLLSSSSTPGSQPQPSQPSSFSDPTAAPCLTPTAGTKPVGPHQRSQSQHRLSVLSSAAALRTTAKSFRTANSNTAFSPTHSPGIMLWVLQGSVHPGQALTHPLTMQKALQSL